MVTRGKGNAKYGGYILKKESNRAIEFFANRKPKGKYMEYLIHLLKNTTLIEWGMFTIAFLIAAVLYIVGIVSFFRAKRKLTIAIITGFVIVPMLLCFATIGVRYFDNQRLYKMNSLGPGDPYYEKYARADRGDYVVAGLIGIALVVPSIVIGTAGMIKKRPREIES